LLYFLFDSLFFLHIFVNGDFFIWLANAQAPL
jgi:hypothetical protein